MSPLNDFFDGILWINLARRPDRAEHAHREFDKHGIAAERVEGVDFGPNAGNDGCTCAHRRALDTGIAHGWQKFLIFEDDFHILHDDFNARFAEYVKEVPADWEFIYLSAHYAEPPKRRVSPHVIQTNHLLTNTSYGITRKMAQDLAAVLPTAESKPHGAAAIDSFTGFFNQCRPTYVFQPRLIVQYPNFSDIQNCEMDNSQAMLDERHEDMLVEGHWISLTKFVTTINCALTGTATDFEKVIIEGKLYRVVKANLPNHPPPWKRGETVIFEVEAAK